MGPSVAEGNMASQSCPAATPKSAATEGGSPVDGRQLELSEWLDRVAKLAGYDSGASLVSETGVCCWMDYYTDGLTPGETWTAECSE